MVLTERHIHHASLIDDFVKSTFERGGNEEDILHNLIDYMPSFKVLLDSTTTAQRDALCQRFDGFYVFASILEATAKGLAEGVIDVAQAHEPESRASNVPTLLPKLTVNKPFIQAFLDAPTPCFALGLVEERKQQYGFLALRPDEVIAQNIMNSGFRFGHSLLGDAQFEVVHFAFEFYGFGTYNVLINPNNPIVQAVLETLLEREDYFFFALDPNHSVTTFRADLGADNLVGFKTHRARLVGSTTTAAQYEKALSQFARNPHPAGTLLTWVCRDRVEALDLANDRLEMSPKP